MSMADDHEVSPESINPIARFAQKLHLFFVLFLLFAALLSGHVGRISGGIVLIKNGWIITAVESNVCLYKEMVGEHPPAITEECLQDAGRLSPLAPTSSTRLECGSHTETGGSQKQ